MQLIGKESILSELENAFTASELQIKKIDHLYILKSDTFQPLINPDDVRSEAKNIVEKVNAGLKFSMCVTTPISVGGGVYNIDKRGNIVQSIVQATLTARYDIIEGDVKQIPKWVKIAQQNAKVSEAFELISNDFSSWFTLYKILELLEEDSFPPVLRKGGHKGDVDRFTQTAQSKAALGITHSRHAKEIPSPLNPMSLNEAQRFIRGLLIEWLECKDESVV